MRQILVVTLACFLLSACAPAIYRVPSENMLPTIKMGDGILADQLYYQRSSVQRFDVVLFKAAEATADSDFMVEKDETWVKRVIGLGGETVEIKQGKVFINGQLLAEPFSIIPSEDDFGPVRVPEGEVFLLGDNRPNSADSRIWPDPTLSQKSITAKVLEVIPQ
ncbi:MAG: signal peptidase I [Acidobacteriota bacterium]|nr:signal peptidase I [Acidobacteriota bacterium]